LFFGLTGYVISDLDPQGTIQLAGEEWSAIPLDDQILVKGTPVKVVDKRGIALIVKQNS